MTHHNILYGLPKQRISQSMRKKGALASYKILEQFVKKHSVVPHSAVSASMRYYVWVHNRQDADEARRVEKILFDAYGAYEKQPLTIWGLPKTNDFYNETFSWELDGDVEQHLTYIDELGPLKGLTPRPPLTITVSIHFWLEGVERIRLNESVMMAWLSPTSNSVSLSLVFPHEATDAEFEKFRENIQLDCPVELEDKYFDIRIPNKKGDSYHFRKAYKK